MVFQWASQHAYVGLVLRRGSVPGTFERVGLFDQMPGRGETIWPQQQRFRSFVLTQFEDPQFGNAGAEQRWLDLVDKEFRKANETRRLPTTIEGLTWIEPQEILIV